MSSWRPGRWTATTPATEEMRELTQARKGIPHGNGDRTRDEIAAFFGDMDAGASRPDPAVGMAYGVRQVTTRSDVMTFLGGVAKKD